MVASRYIRLESTTVTPQPPLVPVPNSSPSQSNQPGYLGYLANAVAAWIPKLSASDAVSKRWVAIFDLRQQD